MKGGYPGEVPKGLRALLLLQKIWFESQHPHGGIQAPTIPGDPMLSSDLRGEPGMFVLYIHRQNAHTYKVIKNFKNYEELCFKGQLPITEKKFKF